MSSNDGTELPKPLEDITVIDATLALSGPFATMLLAGLGARVIKIEDPSGGDAARENAPYYGRDGASLARKHEDDLSVASLSRLRNKLGVTLNLKTDGGRQAFLDLAAKADVVVQNFSSGVMDRLGVGYEAVRAMNRAIVYCSISGFGTVGKPGGGKAMDSIIQAMSGAMLTSGEPDDEPIRIGFPVADLGAPIFGVIGILAAIHQAKRTGEGQHIDVSMLGALTSMLSVEPWAIMDDLGVPTRTGAGLPRLAPFGNYRTLDGYVVICAPLKAFAKGLYTAMGREDLLEHPVFSTREGRVRQSAELDQMIEQWSSKLTTRDAIELLNKHGAPAAEIRTPMEAIRDPAVLARGETNRLIYPAYPGGPPIYGPGIPIVFSGSQIGFDQPPPRLGEHTDQILGELAGYDTDRIAELRAAGAI